MRKLILTVAMIATFTLSAYSQYGGSDFSETNFKLEGGIMIPNSGAFSLSSDGFNGQSSDKDGLFNLEVTQIMESHKPIFYLGFGGDTKTRIESLSRGFVFRVGYEKDVYTVIGTKTPFAPIPDYNPEYRYCYNASRLHINFSYYITLLLLNENLQISAGAGILPTFVLGTSPKSYNGLETGFMDNFMLGFNPEIKVCYYIDNFYVAASYSFVRNVTDSYFGLEEGFGLRRNYNMLSLGCGYHFNRD